MSILVITTGGTIGALAYADPTKPPDVSTFPDDGHNPVLEAVALKPAEGRVVQLDPCDSKDIDEHYLEKLVGLIAGAAEQSILVTHGTDRILQSAEFIYEHLEANAALAQNRMIILTGAMTPLLNGAESDGFVNLEFALDRLADFDRQPDAKKNEQAGLYIVLCDYVDKGVWHPHLYRFEPNVYEKFYDTDGRFHRLQKRQA